MKRPPDPDSGSSARATDRSPTVPGTGLPPMGGLVALGWVAALGLVVPVHAEAAPGGITLPATLPSELPPTVDGKLARADRLVKAGEFSEAARAALSAVHQAYREAGGDPPAADAGLLFERAVSFLLRLADQALEAEEFAVAQQCYTHVRNISPDMWEPVLGLAEVARLTHQPLEAIHLYRAYFKKDHPQDHRGDLGMGLACLALNNPSSARYRLARAVELAPNNAEAAMGLARALNALRKNREALPHAERALRLDDMAPPDERHPEYRYWYAMLLKVAHLDRAIVVVRQLTDFLRGMLKRNPTDTELIDWLERASALHITILKEQAETDQGRRDPKVYMEMAQVAEAQGAIQQIRAYLHALDMLAGALEIDPQNVNALLQVARLSRLVGNRDEAIRTYQSILEISSGNEQAKSALREMGAPLRQPQPTTAGATTTSAATPTR